MVKDITLSEKKNLYTKLPVNASSGHKRLAKILNDMFRNNGCCMTILYEYPLSKLGPEEVVDDFNVHGMSVDFYIRELNLAIEFQGRQHYIESNSSMFGGQIARDKRKKAFLAEMDITLKEIPYSIQDNFNGTDIMKALGFE
jgi:hypothetical protein